MRSEITKRLLQCHDILLQKRVVRSSASFAESLGVQRQSFNKIMKGDREVTLEMVANALREYDINPHWIFQGEEPIFTPKTLHRKALIQYLPAQARAGLEDQFNDTLLMADAEYFSIPGLEGDQDYQCFEVEGDSMEPLFYKGDKVVCSEVNNRYFQQLIKDNHIYVIITRLGDIFLKRVLNKISTRNSIELISDNDFYPPRILKMEEVSALWSVKTKITSNFSDKYIHHLKDELQELKQIVSENKATMEKLRLSMSDWEGRHSPQ